MPPGRRLTASIEAAIEDSDRRRHILLTALGFGTLTRNDMNLLPGGYTFTHIVFWTVVAMVAVGTNAVPIMLSVGIVLLILESVGKA